MKVFVVVITDWVSIVPIQVQIAARIVEKQRRRKRIYASYVWVLCAYL